MSDGSLSGRNALPEHVRFVRGVARSLLFDEQEAEDAAQDTFLRALEKPPKPGNLRGWLRVVVRNFALRRRREERRRKRRELRKLPSDHLASPDEVVARLEGQRRVLEAVRELPEPYRSTIMHRYFDELTREEIAERLQVPLETVRTRLKRALRLLRERLDREDHTAAWVGALLPLFGLHRPAGVVPGSVVASWATVRAAGVAAILIAGASFLFLRHDSPSSPRADVGRVPLVVGSGEQGAPTQESATARKGSPEPLLVAAAVVRDPYGKAIEDAAVEIAAGSFLNTDREGRFRVTASKDGRAPVVVRKDGFLAWRGSLNALRHEEQEIILRAGAPVTVVVLTPERQPLSEAPVQADCREEKGVAGMWWSKRSVRLGGGTTDDQGTVALGAAPVGWMEVRVDDPRYAAWRTEIRVTGTVPVRCEAVLSHGGTVSGKVTAPAGQPIEGARVYSSNWPHRAAVTHADGSYELHSVVEGENRVLVEADGYGTGFFGASLGWARPVPVRVAQGATVTGIDIVLPIGILATGRVVDEDGQPLAGVRASSMVGPCLGRAVTAMTGEDGRYAIGPFATTDGRPVRVTFDYSGYAIDAASADLPTESGALEVADVVARRCGGVSGTVVDADGNPPKGGRVEVVPGGRAVLIRADGTFSLEGLPPGLAQVQAIAWGPLRRSEAVPVTVVPGSVAASGLVLRLEPVRDIKGRVLSCVSRPRAGVVVGAAVANGGDAIVARAVTDETGVFALTDLADGVYRVGILRVPGEEETVAPDARLAFTDDALSVRLVVPGVEEDDPPELGTFLDEPEPLRAATGADDLTFTLETRRTAIEGRVVAEASGLPIDNFEISFIEFWHGLIPRSSQTMEVRDANGRFSGYVREAFWAVEVAAPGYATLRTSVFQAGDRTTLALGTLRLGPGGRLRGAVTDASGDAVSYARLYLLGPQMQTNRRPIFTDALGAYEAEAVPPGSYTIFAVSPRHPLGIVRNTEIKEKETSVLGIRLGRPSPVTVVVTDEAGHPVANADVSYTCEALMPLTSRLLRTHEPPGWGGYRTDGQGRLHKPYFPATRVTFRVKAEGFAKATKVAELREDRETVVEIQLERTG